MFSSTSGLGRLLNSATASVSSQSSRTQRHLESITEESVTYDLLYPDALYTNDGQHPAYPIKYGDPASVAAAARSADDRGGLNIQASRDVRYIIAQKANDFHRVLFDTHPPAPYAGPRNSSASSPEGSDPLKENRFVGGLGNSSRVSRSRTAPHSRQTSLTQPNQLMLRSPSSPISPTPEYGALYGNSQARSIPRPATSEGESLQSKIAREEREETEDILSCIFGASGFPSTSSTKIHIKPYTAQARGSSRPLSPDGDSPLSPRHFEPPKSFLSRSTTAENLPRAGSGVTEHQIARRQSSYVLVTKLFCVDLREEELEEDHGPRSSEPGARTGKLRSVSLPSATNTSNQLRTPVYAVAVILYLPLRSQWAIRPLSPQASPMVGLTPQASFGSNKGRQMTGLDENGFDDRVDRLLDHMSVIGGILSLLEGASRTHIKSMLITLYTELGVHARPRLQLESSALQSHKLTEELIESLTRRLALALRIRPAIPGQDRWAIWRSVARGVSHPSLAHDPGVLSSLLTAFLAGHTAWIDSHAPKDYRRQRRHQSRRRRDCRTVIVSVDKMMSRRIVFFLSSFLPSNRKATFSQQRPQAPLSTPPSTLLPGRTDPHLMNQRSKSFHLAKEATAAQGTDSEDSAGHPSPSHKRRPSDTISIRSLAMPIAPSGTRKSSITTTNTIMPDPQVAIPVFSDFGPDIAVGKNAADPRPDSSGSLAALSLQRTLSRSGSNDRSNSSIDSHIRNGWGSLRSGFWGSRRGSSTENSEVMTSSGEGLGISGLTQSKASNGSINKLSQMVEEVDFDARARGSTFSSPSKDAQMMQQPAKSMPQTSPPEMFPLSLSSDNMDGVIDVQLSSTANFSSSPSSVIPPFPNSPPPRRRPPRPCDPTINVAGWLRAYHPDFTLQAVRPYDTLKAEIKHSMRCFLAPSTDNRSDSSRSSEWTTITTTHLVDLATNTLTILTLRRRMPDSPHHVLNALQHYPANPSDETFVEQTSSLSDPTSTEPILAKALDQLIGHTSTSYPPSRMASRAASRAPSPTRAAASAVERSSFASGSASMPRSTPRLLADGGVAMGRQGSGGSVWRGGGSNEECRRVVHGALKKIVRDVVREAESEGDRVAEGKKQEPAQARSITGRSVPNDKLGAARQLREVVREWVKDVRSHAVGHERRREAGPER